MGLSTFIRTHETLIMNEWESFAATLLPAAENMNREQLRDHVRELLAFIADDLESAQTHEEQTAKGKGEAPDRNQGDVVAQAHAEVRFLDGFDLIQMASEFRALRASVMKLWTKEQEGFTTGFDEVNRFHEAIDQIWMESLIRFNGNITRSRNLFLGALVHDMRNPLSAMSNSVQLLLQGELSDERRLKITSQIERSMEAVLLLVGQLIDTTRVQLGQGLPTSYDPMDLAAELSYAVRQARAAHPERSIILETKGQLTGKWDAARLSQVFSNLLGNAVKHGASTSAIQVKAESEGDSVKLSVHNEGDPIPTGVINTIFDPLVRGAGEKQAATSTTSLGLGLYITKEIITAHRGTIEVTSTASGGTTFTVWLPKHPEIK